MVDSMEKILLAKDRRKAGATAPSQGLFLYKINFDGVRVHLTVRLDHSEILNLYNQPCHVSFLSALVASGAG